MNRFVLNRKRFNTNIAKRNQLVLNRKRFNTNIANKNQFVLNRKRFNTRMVNRERFVRNNCYACNTTLFKKIDFSEWALTEAKACRQRTASICDKERR